MIMGLMIKDLEVDDWLWSTGWPKINSWPKANPCENAYFLTDNEYGSQYPEPNDLCQCYESDQVYA